MSKDPTYRSQRELQRGQSLGRYELLSSVAAGGMARVWAARPIAEPETLVAIKTVLPHLLHDREIRKLFALECEIHRRMQNANVARVIEIGDAEGLPYLVMEWISGETLSELIHSRGVITPFNLRLGAEAVARAAAGLHAAHQLLDSKGRPLGVVHRDVSPHNLMLSEEGELKVIDFGVAIALERVEDGNRNLRGKLQYMPPEHVSGKPYDRRADVFSLGCVLYELTTGKVPFLGENEAQVLQSVIRGDLDLPSKLYPEYPGSLEKIIVKAMSEDPAFRYQSADILRQHLQAWITSSGPPVTNAEFAELVRERAGDRIDARRKKILEGRTLSGLQIPRPPHSMTPSDPSASGVKPVGNRPPEIEAPLALEVISALAPVVPPEPRAPDAAPLASPTSAAPSAALHYIAASAIGVFVALVIALIAILAIQHFRQ